MEFLFTLGYLDYDANNHKEYNSCLKSVQRYLLHLGYKRGQKKGIMCYKMKEQNIMKRDQYVVKITRINSRKDRRIIYMDESYIHKNYARHDDSLYDPNDEQDL